MFTCIMAVKRAIGLVGCLLCDYYITHTQLFDSRWSWTTRVDQYQKKHPLTPILIIGHPLSTSSIYYDPYGRWSWTTRVDRYQKKHPLTPILIIGHPLSTCSIYYDPYGHWSGTTRCGNLANCYTLVTYPGRPVPEETPTHSLFVTYMPSVIYVQCLQCFDAVGWASGGASSL